MIFDTVRLVSRWNSYLALTPTDPGGGRRIGLIATDEYSGELGGRVLMVGQPPLDTAHALAVMERAMQASVSQLTHSGLRVAILAPPPELPFSALHCLYRNSESKCVISRASVEARRGPTMDILRRVAASNPDVWLWDPIDEFCDREVCFVQHNGLLLYGDDDHVSRAMARHLGERNPELLGWLAGRDPNRGAP